MDYNFNNLLDMISHADDATSTSIARFARVSQIQSPMFISETLADEPAMRNLTSNLYNIYMGYILNGLSLNEKIRGSQTVRDILSTVSTEIVGSSESFQSLESLSSEFLEKTSTQNGVGRTSQVDAKKIDIPVGKVINLEINGEDGKKVEIPLTVRLNPRLVPKQVVEQIIATEFKESLSQRWLQLNAGEIGFVKDFIFQLDRLDKRANALKADKDHVLQEVYRQRSKSHFRHMLKLISMFSGKRSVQTNLACSVFVFEKDLVDRMTKKANVDLFKLADRQQFFRNTYALFCVLVDTNYSRVHLFINGVDDVATYTFNELKSKSQDDDIKDFMMSFAKDQLPKF